MASRNHRFLLWVAATDKTYALVKYGATSCLSGKCIHCQRKLLLETTGKPISDATLEHIKPRHHNGDNSIENLAIACGRCNDQKGYRHDCRKWADPTLQRVISLLSQRRKERMRPPLAALCLPPYPNAGMQ